MSYQVKFSTSSKKFFKKLPKHIRERIKNKFREISKNPSRYLEHFEGDSHKIRIGNLRALVDIDNQRRIIFVRVFDKRGRIYK